LAKLLVHNTCFALPSHAHPERINNKSGAQNKVRVLRFTSGVELRSGYTFGRFISLSESLYFGGDAGEKVKAELQKRIRAKCGLLTVVDRKSWQIKKRSGLDLVEGSIPFLCLTPDWSRMVLPCVQLFVGKSQFLSWIIIYVSCVSCKITFLDFHLGCVLMKYFLYILL
jgi:hypothetical protein